MPRIFISYCHESDEIKRRVREIVLTLRKQGIDARLDQFEIPHPPYGWPAWSSQQIIKADYVLLLCTEQYNLRFSKQVPPGIGRGVQYEAAVIENVQYFRHLTTQFVPLLLSADQELFIPAAVFPPTIVTLSGDLLLDVHEIVKGLSLDSGPPLPDPPHSAATDQKAEIPDDASLLTDDVWADVDRRLQVLQRSVDGIDCQLRAEAEPPLILPASEEGDSQQAAGIEQLRYHHRWMRFRPPTQQWQQLLEFVSVDDPFRWWAMIGEGGMGKTRVAYELMLHLDELNWDVGFLTRRAGNDWLEGHAGDWRPQRDTLIVVDYAASRGGRLLEGLYRLSQNPTVGRSNSEVPKVRVLLLDRPGQSEALSVETLTNQDYYQERRTTIRRHLFKPASSLVGDVDKPLGPQVNRGGLSEPLFLNAESLVLKQPAPHRWRALIAGIMESIQTGSSSRLPSADDDPWWQRVDRLTGSGRPLFLQILAICFAQEANLMDRLNADDGLERLLDRMLDQELETRWPGYFPNDAGRSDAEIRSSIDFMHVQRGVSFATLTRGLVLPDDIETLRQVTGGSTIAAKVLPLLLKQSETSESETNGPLKIRIRGYEPDLLGERLILRVAEPLAAQGPADLWGMQPQRAQDEAVDMESWLRAALQSHPEALMEMLGLMVQDFPVKTFAWIEKLVQLVCDEDALTNKSLENKLPGLLINESTIRNRVIIGQVSFDASVNRLLALGDRNGNWNRSIFRCLAFVTEAAAEHDWPIFDGVLYHVVSEFNSNPLWQVAVCLNPIMTFGAHRKMDLFTKWLSLVSEIANRHPSDEAVQEWLATAAFFASHYYLVSTDFPSAKRWGDQLVEVAAKFPANRQIQLKLANGAFVALSHYRTAGRLEEMECWGVRLQSVAQDHPTDAEIQLELAKGAFNAISHYGTAGRLDDMERWGERLQSVAQDHPTPRRFN